MGSTSPDYPYLTNPVFSGELKSVHSWADRMHYENTDVFVKEGVAKIAAMDKTSDDFKACLAWFLGFVSHVIVDSYVHPVINCIVGGPYIFTHAEHVKCEMIQDVFIFHKLNNVDIIDADPGNDEVFGFLNILKECDEPGSEKLLHHAVRDLWSYLLQFAHPQGKDYFADILPDTWHKNYRTRMGFDADPSFLFRHACGMVGISAYKKAADITDEEMNKYITTIPVPSGITSNYEAVIQNATTKIIETWEKLFGDIQNNTADNTPSYVKDWNLDIGVNDRKIELWGI